MASPIIFLDLGGVITDKEQQDAQWHELAGECFAKLLGGTDQAWTLAHQVVSHRLQERPPVGSQPPADFVSFYRSYQLQLLRGMCQLMGTPSPPEEECLRLADQAIRSITSRLRAALPGAVEAIHRLSHLGYTLHLASGACSRELAGYLEGMGMRHCFGRLYGADLINTFKDGPAYYRRLFADADIKPPEAIVVDDSLPALDWAAQTGAQAVLVSASSAAESAAMPRIESLAHLPCWLHKHVCQRHC